MKTFLRLAGSLDSSCFFATHRLHPLRLYPDDTLDQGVQPPKLLLETGHLGIGLEQMPLPGTNFLGRGVVRDLDRSTVHHRNKTQLQLDVPRVHP